MESVRLDKWLWAARIYKTRSQATEGCRSGHVKIEGQNVKPAHEVRVNEMITVKLGGLTRTIKVTGLLDRRVGAGIVKGYMDDLTPASEYEAAREAARQTQLIRPKGLGRPTKKDRRLLVRFNDMLPPPAE